MSHRPELGGGCPRGNIDDSAEEKNGSEVIRLAPGMVVGYPHVLMSNDLASSGIVRA